MKVCYCALPRIVGTDVCARCQTHLKEKFFPLQEDEYEWVLRKKEKSPNQVPGWTQTSDNTAIQTTY